MKISFFKRINTPVYLAFSGGVDSAVLLHLLVKRKVDVKLLFIHHRGNFCDEEQLFAENLSKELGIELLVKQIEAFKGPGSKEAYWSRERYKIFQAMDRMVLTGHHLDDAVEWYIMSTFQGTPKILEYQNNNVIRPLICTPKSKIYEYAQNRNLEHLSDPSNSDPNSGLRNKTRIKLMGSVHECYPGLRTTVCRLIREKEENRKDNEPPVRN